MVQSRVTIPGWWTIVNYCNLSIQSRRHFASNLEQHTWWEVSCFTPVVFLDTIVTHTPVLHVTLCVPPVASSKRDQQWTLTRRLLRFGKPSWLGYSLKNYGNHWVWSQHSDFAMARCLQHCSINFRDLLDFFLIDDELGRICFSSSIYIHCFVGITDIACTTVL